MSVSQRVKHFFLPEFNRRYALRLVALSLCAFILFRYILAPFYIQGESMAPTYRTGGITFSWRLAYMFSEPQRGDIVIIRLAGERVALLKRIVALPGEQVEFRDGELFINGRKLDEPYLVKPSDWNQEPRIVEECHYYVVGDNRSMPIEEHHFGEVAKKRIIGALAW